MGDGIAEVRAEAQAGNIERIYALLQDYPSVLRRIDDDSPFADTPLHIAVERMAPNPQNDEEITSNRRYGEFALEMMNLKPSFARKLNPSGLSPMHLAVQKSQTLVVRELLKIDKDLARVKGKGGQTALHFAADHDALDLLVEFLEACPECITDVNIHGQTAFQVAVKNRHCEAAKLLASWICWSTHKDSTIWERVVLNGEDHEGNTVLHIAALNNDPQMVRLLLDLNVSKNKINLKKQTALDISEGKNDCGLTTAVLRQAKCRNASAIHSRPTLAYSLISTELSFMGVLLRNMTRGHRQLSSKSINALLVVYALILAATYQACLSPLGGFTQGNNPDNFTQGNITGFHNISSTNQPPTLIGLSVLKPVRFNLFYSVNTLTFGVTVFTMIQLLCFTGIANGILIVPPLILFIFCYSTSVSMISPTYNPVYVFLPLIIYVFLYGLILARRFYFSKFATWRHNIH